MPKKQGAVRKECESCDQQIPVACKTCPQCSHELIPEKDLRREEVTPESIELDSNADIGERRRSVRAKRDKPDYYDALDYDSKRQKTPRSERKKAGVVMPVKSGSTGKMRRFPGTTQNQTGRATLSWRKEEEDYSKKKLKRVQNSGSAAAGSSGNNGGGNPSSSGGGTAAKKDESDETDEPVLEDIPAEKVFSCAVSLAEINRKLGLVMWKPVPTS